MAKSSLGPMSMASRMLAPVIEHEDCKRQTTRLSGTPLRARDFHNFLHISGNIQQCRRVLAQEAMWPASREGLETM